MHNMKRLWFTLTHWGQLPRTFAKFCMELFSYILSNRNGMKKIMTRLKEQHCTLYSGAFKCLRNNFSFTVNFWMLVVPVYSRWWYFNRWEQSNSKTLSLLPFILFWLATFLAPFLYSQPNCSSLFIPAVTAWTCTLKMEAAFPHGVTNQNTITLRNIRQDWL
jgi:hypothetical protein